MADFNATGLKDTELDTVLREIGWDQRFSLPELSPANRASSEEIHKAEMELSLENNEVARIADRKQLIAEETQRSKLQSGNTEASWKANEKELEVMKHSTALAETESGRLAQSIAQTEKELSSAEERKDVIEKNLLKAHQQLEESRSQMEWDQETMDNFLEESAQKDDDLMAIIKYAQQDEQRIKSLTLAREKTTSEAKEKRRALDKELTETRSTQLALDRTVDNIQQVRSEIQQLFQHCENSIKQKKQLDSDMQRSASKLAQGKQQIREKNANLAEVKHILGTERNNNAELQRKIASRRGQAAELRQDSKKQEENLARMQVELNSHKAMSNVSRSDVRSSTFQISRMKKDIEDNNEKIKQAKAYNAASEEKSSTVTQSTLSEEERAAQMEQILQESDQAIKKSDAQQHDLMEESFRQKHHFQLVKTKEKNLTAQMSKNKFILTNSQKQIAKMEKESGRQQEIMINRESTISGLQKQLDRSQGVVDSDESQKLEEKIAESTKDSEAKKQTAKRLSNAMSECEADIRCSRKEMEKLEAQKKDSTDVAECSRHICMNQEKELKKLKSKKQDAIMDNNLLKTEVKRVRDLVYLEADSMSSSEMRKLESEKAMKEREDEINVHSEMLRQQLKITEQDRQGSSIELNKQLSKIETMKKRFEVLEESLPGFEGEKSQASYIVKMAQEKEELKRRRDESDGQVRKMELETKALENTIQLFSDHTSSLWSGLSKVKKSTPEYQEKVQSEENSKATEETSKFKKRRVNELRQDIQDMNTTWERLSQEERAEKEKIDHKQRLIAKSDKEATTMQEKISRATKQFIKLTKEIRSAKNSKSETSEEQHIKSRELKEFNKTINKMLNKAMEDDAELRPVSEQHFQQTGSPLPSPTSTLSSHRSLKLSSARSSVSLRSFGSSAGSSPPGSPLASSQVKKVNSSSDSSGACAPLTPPTCPSSAGSSGSNSSRKMEKR